MRGEGAVHTRRVKVVDGRFQYRMIAISLSIVLLGLLLFAALAALWYLAARASGNVPGPELLMIILPPLLLNDLAIMIVAIVVGIFVTHRIAGPVYRMAADIDRALSGQRGVRVNLRRKDSLAELAEKVNALIERIDATRAG
jgi:methyl-accepting chemotaxis protein